MHNWGNIESYRKNEESKANSYTLMQRQVVGNDGGQYMKSN